MNSNVTSSNNWTFFESGEQAGGVSLGAVAMEYVYDKDQNLRKYIEIIRIAGEKGVNFLVFPEQSMQGYVWESELAWDAPSDLLSYQYENSETVPGPATATVAEEAGKYEMVVVVGMTERHPTYGRAKGGLYNSAVIVSGDGVLGVHRKAHSCGTEKHVYSRGRDIGVTDTPIGQVGIAICYDLWFPETARVAAIRGAEILAHPTVWPAHFAPPLPPSSPDAERWDYYHALMRVRAVENQMWLVAGSGAGIDERTKWELVGQAKIVGPDGVTKVETPPRVEGIAVAHGCDIAGEIATSRTQTYWGDSFLFDRNPRAYGPIADEGAMYPPG